MPLSARARIELYVPDQPVKAYKNLLQAVIKEFTQVFGGCTIKRAEGSYLSDAGETVKEPVLIVYSDSEFDLEENRDAISDYADRLREDVYTALDEEEILVALLPVQHSI